MHPQQDIQEPHVLDKGSSVMSPDIAWKYRYWRIRVMYAMIFGYATFYLVRLNFAMAIPTMMEELHYTKQQFGWILTLAAIIYGIGKFINGYLSDRSNARFFISIALIGTAVMNFVMGFGQSLLFFAIVWGLNSWFQSMAWPPISRLLTHWYSPKELGTKWGLWNSSHQIGGATIFILAAYLIEHYGWKSAFFVPSIVGIIMSFFLYNRLRDTPQSMGLPAVEYYKGLRPVEEKEEEYISNKDLCKRVFRNKLLWYVCFGNMFLYIVRMGVMTWAPSFLKEMKGSTLLLSGGQAAAFEIAGLLGGIAAGWLSDHVFLGRRGPVSVIYMLSLVCALFCFWKAPADAVWLNTALMFGVGFLVYGPQVLVGVAAADFASKKAVGMATGLTGTMGYLGGAISGIGVGYVAEHYGWEGGFIFFTVSALAGALMFALTWHHRAQSLENPVERESCARYS